MSEHDWSKDLTDGQIEELKNNTTVLCCCDDWMKKTWKPCRTEVK